jgi:hypothetical protein
MFEGVVVKGKEGEQLFAHFVSRSLRLPLSLERDVCTFSQHPQSIS